MKITDYGWSTNLLEDFAETPRFTVGGTVTGLIGTGQLELEISAEGPIGQPTTFRLRPRRLLHLQLSQARQREPPPGARHPAAHQPGPGLHHHNASGTIEDADVTNVEVQCL